MFLLSPPMLALLIILYPGIQVNPVIQSTAAQLDGRNVQFTEQCDADTEVGRSFLLGQKTHRRQWQANVIHG
ncbi:hypothetical protein SAMN05216326_1455 [Nitrosomonas marina]|uniref:Uncharacterized protein n=1 Tax=Nitrosomonas marina TaxID=917 RepID=A0A1I0FW83_9PROT|nr:hypothetical protein SAMN05216326_1455 [Nitrosomonas marina]